MAFATMSLSQLFHGFNLRSTTRSLFRVGFTTNRYMVLAWTVSASLQLMVLVIPGLRFIFEAVPLTLSEWGYVGLLSVSPVISVSYTHLDVYKRQSLKKETTFPQIFAL